MFYHLLFNPYKFVDRQGASVIGKVKIGKGSIVATNTIVTQDGLPYSLVAGVPAKIIKELNRK